MTASNTYPMRQMEERHMATKVELMVWSQKMDLLAISNIKGEVALHRLSWQKVWSLSPPGEGVKATGIAWRSDGKVIAISYTNNEIHLINVENKDVIGKKTYSSTSEVNVEGPLINFLCWLEERYNPKRSNNEASQNRANSYLPKLPPLSRSFGAIAEEAAELFEDSKKTDDQHELNILIVGLADGRVDLLVFGIFEIGELALPGAGVNRIVAADASSDLGRLYVLVLVEDSTFKLYAYNTSILAVHSAEIHALGSKYGQVTSLMEYLDNTMQAVMEACENMLLSEMESKLSQHADSMPRGSVSADLLELLMFGVASETLETFLLKGLTDKGLNKLSHSMDVCHSNIQKLILHHLRPVGQKIAFLLSDLRAMARLVERYQVIGLEEETVTNSYRENGSFLVKAYEVVGVTDTSLKKYRALFKWLYDVIMRLMDEAASLPGVSDQDIAFIADYLYNLEGNGEEEVERGDSPVPLDSAAPKKKYCYLDVLSQYIVDADLAHPVPPDNNPWEKFLLSNPGIECHPNIIPRYPNLSLVQQHNRLKSAIANVFDRPKKIIGCMITLDDVVQLVQTSMTNPRVTMRFIDFPSQIVIATILHPNTAYFTFFAIDVGQSPSTSKCKTNVYFKSMDTTVGFTTVDLQLFNHAALSVLLAEPADGAAVFAQLHLDRVEEAGRSKSITSQINPVAQDGELYVDGCLLLDTRMKNLDNMRASRLAVSGGRKVAVILSENTHKVRTYEMEVDEEDEEEEDAEANRSSEAC